MASLREYRDKNGKLVSYLIRVNRGKDSNGKQLRPWTETFKVAPAWSEKTAYKKAQAYAAQFEKECKSGMATDTRLRFDQYCDYVLELKEKSGLKRSTLERYRELTVRIYDQIGYLKLKDIRTDHLNAFYMKLSEPGQNLKTGEGLSPKTIQEYHRLISSVLEQATKESLIPYNPASRATLPRYQKPIPNYYQPETVAAILDALESEPIFWKTLVHMMLVTGCRRGEILGLKWSNVDFSHNKIFICNNVLYSPKIGVYESTPKTEKSKRFISLPAETMRLLKQYRAWQSSERLRMGEYYVNRDFVFASDSGDPIHPDSVSTWLNRFSERHNLPHLNCHAFRHTAASLLLYNGVDIVSVAYRLGHASPSTTANVYSHVIADADEKNADIIADAILKHG